nr:uncharacterized protein LOC112290216 isoform X3 [Physcomitrium patens]|eukprot:XP_024392062.1 uncharacterized protein LOC112290216 isoform X3 [Physcomitrella patens]
MFSSWFRIPTRQFYSILFAGGLPRYKNTAHQRSTTGELCSCTWEDRDLRAGIIAKLELHAIYVGYWTTLLWLRFALSYSLSFVADSRRSEFLAESSKLGCACGEGRCDFGHCDHVLMF